MRFNKITALVLLIALLVSGMPTFAQEENKTSVTDTADYEKNVDFITFLEIYSFPEEKPDSTVSRATFAKMVADLLGINKDYNTNNCFTDVPQSNLYACEIDAMAALGIMNGVGDGRFLPDEPITYRQAIKTVVTALGYTPAATVAGGYSDGYLRCAYNIGIVDNPPYDFDAPLTFDTAANLIKLSAEAEVYEIVYLTNDKAYFASYEDNTALNVYHSIYIGEGVMTDNGITAINGETALAIDCSKIGKKVLTGTDDREREFLGCYVEYYYKQDNNALLYVSEKTGRNDIVTVKAYELLTESGDFSKTCVTAEINGKKKKYRIDPYANLIYNGGLDKTFNGETLKIKDGTLKLIDADMDGDYETVIAEEYRDIVFKNCNAETKKFVATYSEDDYAFINYGEYKTCIFQNAAGEQILPDGIKENSVVSVFRSKNNEKIRFIVSELTLEIVAESVETAEDGKIRVIFGDMVYEFSNTYETLMNTKPVTFNAPVPGSSYRVLLNYEGNIAMLIETQGRLQYAYMLDAGKTGQGLDGGRVSVKLLLESNDYVTVPVADKLTFDGIKNKTGNDILSSSIFFDAATGNIKPQLVMVRINSDGKLKELDSATDNTGSMFGFDLENFSLDFVSESGYSTKSINGLRTYNGNQIITSNTKIFAVNTTSKTVEETNEELVSVIDYTAYTRRYGSCYLKLYDADDGWEAGAIVVSEPLDINSRLFVVTEAYVQKDFDGEFKQAINGWWAQDFRSFVESYDGILSEAVKKRYPDSNGKILAGDVFEIGFDNEEGISRARIVYSPQRDTDPDYTYFDMNGQTEINDDENYYILGYPCHVGSNKISTYSKANADYINMSGNKTPTEETFWTTILQSESSSMSIFEFDCETKEVKVITRDKIPSAAQLTAKGYENFNPDTKVLLKRIDGTVYDLVVITNMNSQYD